MAKTKITEKMFNAAKTLFKGGATVKEVAEYLGIGVSPAGRIKVAETYEDYCTAVHASTWTAEAAKAKANPQKQQTVTVQATHYMMTELQKANELLTAISAKLAFIVDELTK